MRCLLKLLMLAALPLPGPARAVSVSELEARGYAVMDCLFRERCVIGAPCERDWRDLRWYYSDATGLAYRDPGDGPLREGRVLRDADWTASPARSIVMPMYQHVGGHLTWFANGAAIYAIQYAGGPGSAQFLRGQCDVTEPED